MKEKEYTPDNIEDLFKEMDSLPNSNLRKYIMYCGYKRDCDRLDKVLAVQQACGPCGHCIPTIIDEDMAVVERTDIYGRDHMFSAFLDGVPSSRCYLTFDEALLAAVCWKNTGREDAAEWMWRMIKEGKK